MREYGDTGGREGGGMKNLDFTLARLGTIHKHFQTIILETKIRSFIRLMAQDALAREYARTTRLQRFF